MHSRIAAGRWSGVGAWTTQGAVFCLGHSLSSMKQANALALGGVVLTISNEGHLGSETAANKDLYLRFPPWIYEKKRGISNGRPGRDARRDTQNSGPSSRPSREFSQPPSTGAPQMQGSSGPEASASTMSKVSPSNNSNPCSLARFTP